MKTFLTAIALVSTLLVGAAQAEVFYAGEKSGIWQTFGLTGDGSNPVCLAMAEWPDGSDIQYVKDLADGELYVRIYNVDWDITDSPGTEVQARVNFYKDDQFTAGGTAPLIVVNHNTVVLANLEPTKFTPAFMENHVMRVVMPGTTSNIAVALNGSSDAVMNMAECMVEYDMKDPSEKTPTVPGRGA
tara:strand:- start:7042 stop:7602 length:561 start_codon:yes stop_codon:yes gene_type:complete